MSAGLTHRADGLGTSRWSAHAPGTHGWCGRLGTGLGTHCVLVPDVFPLPTLREGASEGGAPAALPGATRQGVCLSGKVRERPAETGTGEQPSGNGGGGEASGRGPGGCKHRRGLWTLSGGLAGEG